MLFLKKIHQVIFQPEKKLIFPPKRNILALGFVLVALSLTLPFVWLPFVTALLAAALCLQASLLLLILFVEIWFRLAYRKVYGLRYQLVPDLDRESFIYEPHPFISYVRKPDFKDKDLEDSNNLRATFAPGQSRYIEIPKPEGVFRVSCLGASETAFYEQNGAEKVSYPSILEKILQDKFPGQRVEVNNFSTPGHTTAEILSEFLLNSFDSQPDVVVFYHGYNDIRAFLTPGFKNDYSHFRRNFAAEYEKLRIVNLLPFVPLAFYNFLLWNHMPKRIVGRDVHYAVTRGKMDIDAEPQGINIFRRNLEHIINVCRANGMQMVLSTFCHFFDDESRADAERLKWENKVREVVLLENRVVSDLAREHGLPLVDNLNLIPQDHRHFNDKIHFTLDGMKLLAENLSVPIAEHLADKFKRGVTRKAAGLDGDRPDL